MTGKGTSGLVVGIVSALYRSMQGYCGQSKFQKFEGVLRGNVANVQGI